MIFEFDPNKSAANKAKHGIDFVEAQALWQDPRVVTTNAGSVASEARSVAIGMLGGKVWFAVFVRRGEALRIISARRAQPKEVQFYEANKI